MKINITFEFTEEDIKDYLINKDDIIIKTSKKEFNKAFREELKDYIENTVYNYLWSQEMGVAVEEELTERGLIERL